MNEAQIRSAKAFTEILRKKNEEIAQLKAEIESLKGYISEAQRKQDEEDRMVFDLLHSSQPLSTGCIHIERVVNLNL